MAIFKAIVRTKRKDGFYQVCIQCVHNRKPGSSRPTNMCGERVSIPRLKRSKMPLSFSRYPLPLWTIWRGSTSATYQVGRLSKSLPFSNPVMRKYHFPTTTANTYTPFRTQDRYAMPGTMKWR